jgi:hypothetical protein
LRFYSSSNPSGERLRNPGKEKEVVGDNFPVLLSPLFGRGNLPDVIGKNEKKERQTIPA